MNDRTEIAEAAPAPAAAPAPQAGAPADGKVGENEPGKNPKAASRKSLRETVKAAAAEVATREASAVTETESAARVLRGESEYPDAKEQKPAAKPAETAAKEPAAKADAKAEAKPAADKPAETAKEPAAKEPPVRDPATGKFQSPAAEAAPADKPAEAAAPAAAPPPSRFSSEAKAAWDTTPEPVRKEVERAIGELTSGLQKYQQAATSYETIRQYEPLAQRYNMSLPQVLADYAGMSNMMNQGLDGAMQVMKALTQRHGISMQEIASKVLDEELDEYVGRTSGELAQAQKENATLKEQLAQANAKLQGFAAQQRDVVLNNVKAFAERNPRFNELEPTIKWILATNGVDKSDPVKALQEAYEMAERLKPAPSSASPAAAQPAIPAAQPKPDLTAQTGVAQKSVHGSPGPGSTPGVLKPAKSVRDAVRSAAGRTGVA